MAIYMNYVRKLGFEETPNYDFMRDLFTKVLETLGEPEDGIFDWMLLNGGKGWEAGNVRVPLQSVFLNLEPLLFRVQTSLHKSMPTLLTLHTATATANTEEIANMVDIAVVRDSCMTTIHRQHHSSLARHLLTSKSVAADKKGNEELPQKMPAVNLLLLLRDERANNNNQLHLVDCRHPIHMRRRLHLLHSARMLVGMSDNHPLNTFTLRLTVQPHI
jgi:hypothetical protein